MFIAFTAFVWVDVQMSGFIRRIRTEMRGAIVPHNIVNRRTGPAATCDHPAGAGVAQGATTSEISGAAGAVVVNSRIAVEEVHPAGFVSDAGRRIDAAPRVRVIKFVCQRGECVYLQPGQSGRLDVGDGQNVVGYVGPADCRVSPSGVVAASRSRGGEIGVEPGRSALLALLAGV